MLHFLFSFDTGPVRNMDDEPRAAKGKARERRPSSLLLFTFWGGWAEATVYMQVCFDRVAILACVGQL